jgi:hypothetical protein
LSPENPDRQTGSITGNRRVGVKIPRAGTSAASPHRPRAAAPRAGRRREHLALCCAIGIDHPDADVVTPRPEL